MRFKYAAILAVSALLSLNAPAVRAAESAASDTKTNSALVPVPRDEKWVKRHEGFVAADRDFDLLFLGDSITDFWRSRGKAVWATNFASMKAANFGISGDKTEHVLWRIDHGELDGAHPKLTVLMIGTNNTRNNSAPEIAEGVTAVVKRIQAKCPSGKILLLGVFPRSENADDAVRGKIKNINAIISKLDNGKSVKYLDIGAKFLDAEGTLSKDIMPDFLHPNEKGYQIWAEAITPTVKEMMK